MSRIVALAGRPNTGKTTLFNALTGLRQRVGNFAGCTVEKAVGVLDRGGVRLEVVDLPGTFSIVPSSLDEQVAFRFLSELSASKRPFSVVCVAEASNLHNDLALALSLKACGYPVVLAVNMIDEAESNGVSIDAERLGGELGLEVALVSARYGRGLDVLLAAIDDHRAPRGAMDFRTASKSELALVHERSLRAAEESANRCVTLPRRALLPTIARSIRLDRWLFHPLAGPVILAASLFAVFETLFALGGPAKDALTSGFDAVSAFLRPLIPSELAASLVCDGVIAGVAAVLSFLPQIAILFLMIGFLEQSGYLPRAGAMVDRALRPFGLDGKVFIPFLSSFACAIPGVMATRTIADERRRLTAVLLCPLMTCSARIPVYTLIIGAFVPAQWRVLGLSGQGVVMAAMYALGVLAALSLALVLKAAKVSPERALPVTVLPPYRRPHLKELLRYVWIRCWHFISRAGKVIFVLSVLLWALASFPRRAPLPGASPAQAAAAAIEGSVLGSMGRAIEPLFKPIGYDWRLSVAVLSSLAAREVFVGTIGTLLALGGDSGPSQKLSAALSTRYGLPTAVSLLLFFAIALQCVSTIAVVRRETGGWKWPLIQFACFFVFAYALAFAGFRLTAALL